MQISHYSEFNYGTVGRKSFLRHTKSIIFIPFVLNFGAIALNSLETYSRYIILPFINLMKFCVTNFFFVFGARYFKYIFGSRYTPPRKIPSGIFHPGIFSQGMFPPDTFFCSYVVPVCSSLRSR